MDVQTYEKIRGLPSKERIARIKALPPDERDEYLRIGKEHGAKRRAQKLKNMKSLLTIDSKWVLNCLYNRNYVVEITEVHRTKATVFLRTGTGGNWRKCDIVDLEAIEDVEARGEKIYDFTGGRS